MWQVMQRVQESEVWRDLIFSPVREQGPRLLHGNLWLGNMAVDTQRRSNVVGPASWFGPADFDLAVGETFGMPERFRQAYEHYCPGLEASKERGMLYRLYILLNHINQPASYKYSSNVGREPLLVALPRPVPCPVFDAYGEVVQTPDKSGMSVGCSFRYTPDNFLGDKTLTSFRTTSVRLPSSFFLCTDLKFWMHRFKKC